MSLQICKNKIETAVKMRLEGCSIKEISSYINASVSYTSKMLRGKGVLTNPQWRKAYSIDESFFEKIDSPEKAYFLGWLASDGMISDENSCFRLAIQEKDTKILEQFNFYLKSNRPIKVSKKAKPHHQDIHILNVCSRKLVDCLISYGLVPNKTFRTYISKKIPENLIRFFLRGLFEGDGTISLTKRDGGATATVCFYSASKKMAEDTAHFINKLSGISVKVHHVKRKHPYKDMYNVMCGGNLKVIKLMSWLYSEGVHLKLDRKYNIYESFERKYFENLKNSIPVMLIRKYFLSGNEG